MTRLPKFATPTEALSYTAKQGIRIRIFYGDPATGKDDCDETRRSGKIKQTRLGAFVMTISTSHDPCARGSNLHTIDLSRVVRVSMNGRGSRKARDLYRHPAYNAGNWSSYYRSDLGRWIAIRNGVIHATFATEAEAALYADYIQGNRARPTYQDNLGVFEALKRRERKKP